MSLHYRSARSNAHFHFKVAKYPSMSNSSQRQITVAKHIKIKMGNSHEVKGHYLKEVTVFGNCVAA